MDKKNKPGSLNSGNSFNNDQEAGENDVRSIAYTAISFIALLTLFLAGIISLVW